MSTQNDNSHLGFVFKAKLHKDLFFEDDYNLINNKDSKLFLGWTLDMRKIMGDKKQVYSINVTSATYKQHNDLTNEISLIANM